MSLDELRTKVEQEIADRAAAADLSQHRFRWYGCDGRDRYERTTHMPDSGWGWDAVCSCGYDTPG